MQVEFFFCDREYGGKHDREITQILEQIPRKWDKLDVPGDDLLEGSKKATTATVVDVVWYLEDKDDVASVQVVAIYDWF